GKRTDPTVCTCTTARTLAATDLACSASVARCVKPSTPRVSPPGVPPMASERERLKRDGFFAGLTCALDSIIVGHDQPVIADDMLRELGASELRAYGRHVKRNEPTPAIRKYVADAVRRLASGGES